MKEIKKQVGLLQDQMEIEFEIGNTHVEPEKGKNTHKWSCYIKATDPAIQKHFSKIVTKAKFELHETYRNPVRVVESKPGKVLALDSSGWGFFDIPVTITFAKATGKIDPFSYTWPLSFSGTGKSKKFKLTFDSTKIKPLMEPPKKAAAPNVNGAKKF